MLGKAGHTRSQGPGGRFILTWPITGKCRCVYKGLSAMFIYKGTQTDVHHQKTGLGKKNQETSYVTGLRLQKKRTNSLTAKGSPEHTHSAESRSESALSDRSLDTPTTRRHLCSSTHEQLWRGLLDGAISGVSAFFIF